MADAHGTSSTQQRRRTLVGVVLLGCVAVAIAFSSLLPARRAAHRTHTLLERQEEANRVLATREAELREEIDAIENEPWTNLRLQRDELRLFEPGEVMVK